MNDEVLLRFLNAGLIDVGGDDAKLEKLRETAADLASILKKTPSKATAFALVAFDPNAPPNDPVITEGLQALQSRWATYVNTFAGKPVNVIRAVLLDALVRAAKDEDKIGVAFVTSARNALPFMEAGNEQAIWVDVVGMIEKSVDARAEAEWATPSSITMPPMTLPATPPIKAAAALAAIEKEALLKQIEAAAGPSNAAGQPTNGNPNWASSNAPWVTEFSNRLADALVGAFATAGKGLALQPIDLSPVLESFAKANSAYVDATLKSVSGATAGLQRRTNLIWWKEALYSPSARCSYRQLPTASAAALMAFDLHQQIPTFSPASVAAFLHETVLSLPSLDLKEERPIRDLLEEAQGSEALSNLREAVAEHFAAPVGRGPIFALIGHPQSQSPIDDQTFRDLVGIPAKTLISMPAWATWLFRELQAARATNEGADGKRRGRKAS